MATVTVEVLAKDSFSGVLGNFGSIMTGVESAINLAGQAFGFLKDQAMAGLDAVASYERLELSLQSLIASQMVQAGVATDVASAMEVAGIQAEELVKWNEELAIKSPFTSEGVAQAFRMSMAYGFTTDEAQRLTEAMIDFAAGSGASEYAMQQIARALGQISATGKLTGGDMLQLVNAGLPVAEILADAFGVTTAKVMEMREKGLIPAQDAIEAITVYLETNFKGAAEAQANTWAGLKGTFEDLKQMGLREFFGGLFEAIQPVAVAFAGWLQTEGMDKLKEWGESLGNIASAMVTLAAVVTGDGETIIQFGVKIFEMGENSPMLAEVGKIIVQMGRDIEEGTPPLEAFTNALKSLFDENTLDVNQMAIKADTFVAGIFDKIGEEIDKWVDGDGPKTLSEKMIAWIDTVGTPTSTTVRSKSATAAGNLFQSLDIAISGIDWSGIADAIDDELADELAAKDWSKSGTAFNEGLGKVFQAEGSWDDPTSDKWSWLDRVPFMIGLRLVQSLLNSDSLKELDTAINGFFSGLTDPIAKGLEDWFRDDLVPYAKDNWLSMLFPLIPNDEARKIMSDNAGAMLDGLIEGLNEVDVKVNTWVTDHIIAPIKKMLGIASPSTVFTQIGKDIVSGLMSGILSMFPSLTSVVSTLFNLLTGGSGRTGGATGDATGLLGGGSSTIGGSGTSGVLMGGTVTNIYNFYGTTYVSGAGPAGTYDCAPTISSGGMIPAGVR
jgi:tape measure domain-containing protein